MAETTLIEIEVPTSHAEYWKEAGRYPVVVERRERFVKVAGNAFRIVRNDKGGYFCYRLAEPGVVPQCVVLGEVYPYGVRRALTSDLHLELSALRAALYPNTAYPSPLCYEMRGGDLVHPGPCFNAYPGSMVKATKYQLTGVDQAICATCKERIL